MEKRARKTALLLVLVGLYGISYGAQVEFPLVQSISYFPFHDNTPLKRGGLSLSLDMYYSNIYMFQWDETTINDMEMFSNTLALRYGISDRLTLELYHKLSLVYGGFMDRFVMDFHEAFNLPSDARDYLPVDSVHYKFKDRFFYQERVIAAAPLVVGAAANVVNTENVHLLARLALGIPLVPKPGFSSERPFLAAGGSFNYRSGGFHLGLSGYASFYKAPKWLEDEPIRYNIFTYEIKVGYKWLFAYYVFRSSPFEEGDLAHSAYQVGIGFKITRWLEFAVIEDFYPYDTTPDFSFNLRLHLVKK